MVVGLGNREVTPDALGPEAVNNLMITRHVVREYGKAALGKEKVHLVSGIVPGVMAQTGMETFEIIKGIIDETKPDVVVAIDAKRRADGSGWNIYKNGGRIDVGLDAVEWARKVEDLGAGEILLTSMDCDGTKAGYDLELTRTIAEQVRIPVIASGGAGTLAHFKEALTEGKADAALAASLFHYKELEIKEVKKYLRKEGVSVRL